MTGSLFLFAAQAMTFTADRIAADDATKTVVASGRVVAVSAPMTVRGEYMSRAEDGTFHFRDPTYATTCTNGLGHTHWNVTGELKYRADDYVLLRNAWLTFCEVPVLWLPYLYYPLDMSDCGFSWMPGYTGRWGGYLLTRYAYDLIGGGEGESAWLRGATRADLRYEQGLAVGEDLKWNLRDFGSGRFDVYYAWDRSDDVDRRARRWYSQNWGSEVDERRYGMTLSHRFEPTERDQVRLRGTYLSDSYFRRDFLRKTPFNAKSHFLSYDNSGVFWEHLENAFSAGAEVSGRLNDFYGMTGRLPELYFDVNPTPLFGLPVNYESESRIGYLMRDYAEYGNGDWTNPFCRQPGGWAAYEAARFDTYHRLTAPFRTFGDVLSVVPRLAYRGTCWNRSGEDNLTGWGETGDAGSLYRSVLESGVTFAGRGTGRIGERWRHLVEPYLDVLAQEAYYAGSGDRPYVFDNLDASVMWEDQFAGRGRNLPYSYYGLTPGLRNVWEQADEQGRLKPVVDLDAYVALQFNDASYRGVGGAHRLAKTGRPNYGGSVCEAVPGARLRWMPAQDLTLMTRVEYDAVGNSVPVADAGVQHEVGRAFKYHVSYALRDYRIWDFSSMPYDPARMTSEDLNYAKVHSAEIGFEHSPIDWLAWSPYVRWDLRESELDCIGAWFDLLTDCLGFRFLVEYENDYTRIDGYRRDDDWSFGFYVYLRAFGANGSNIFH